MTNIRELAKLAGVSIATVSRVINNPQLVQPETREHVLSIMNEVNYSPAWSMESRLSGRSNLITFLFCEADYPFYYPIINGLESVARHHSTTVQYCPISDEGARKTIQLESLAKQKCDGYIWALRDFDEDDVEIILKTKSPIVLARRYDNAPQGMFNCCYINFAEASSRMTQHLLNMGHRRIGLMFENVSQQFMKSFCIGWEDALIKNGITPDNQLIFSTPNSMPGGYHKTLELIEQNMLPDALFCASDELAFGVLRAAHEKGVKVPEQLAVAGLTDSPMSRLSEPGLTTVDLPTHRLGIVTARMLFDIIEDTGLDTEVHEQIALQPKLRIRQSCGNTKPINVLYE